MTINRIFGLVFALLLSISLLGCSIEFEFAPLEKSVDALSQEGNLQVIFLDVGQGDSVLLLSPNGKTMLIDAGDNDKKELMQSYLDQYGIKKLDVIIATHPHADHIGGLDRVIKHVEVDQIYMPRIAHTTKTYENLLLAIKQKGLKVSTAWAGVNVTWDEDVQVNMVGPVNEYKDLNNMSAVVKVTYGKVSFLLTGDAEALSEQDMVASGTNLSAHVLGVGHHGSHTSTTEEFLKKVNPRYGVIQSGADNRYGHPHKEILDRLAAYGVDVYRNDLDGTVTFITDGESISILTER